MLISTLAAYVFSSYSLPLARADIAGGVLRDPEVLDEYTLHTLTNS
jgi:hypothetical protein